MPTKPRTRRRRWPYILEKDFQDTVVEYAHLCGWMTYHTHDSRRSDAGFPDLTMVRGTRLIFAELKSQKGTIRPAQEAWLQRLQGVPAVEVYLWRPTDWDDIEKVLLGGSVTFHIGDVSEGI